ncbi:MAG: YciI family protein [Bythopirellula sp.]|nr:YciI family protein [Bythopirellula sp.]
MRYLLLSYDDEKYWKQAGKEVHAAAIAEAVELTHELHSKGQYILASPLAWSDTATSVRVRNGKPIITDGPFAETNEVLGGFYLIEAGNIEEAISIAARHPGVRVGTVEIRPVLEIAGLPEE